MTASSTADRYRAFARSEALGVSPILEAWALAIAADAQALALVDGLPEEKRQPNLVFAAARASGSPPTDATEFAGWVAERWDQVRSIALRRSTQTNEPARSIALVAALASVPGPVALLEIGASAGLCLFPDRYRYRIRTDDGEEHELGPASGAVLDCAWLGGTLPPTTLPHVVRRAGLDRNPLDVADPEDAAWLEQLVWPEQEDRRRHLRAAIAQARLDPPDVRRGDAVADLESAAEAVPAGGRLVVVHSALLAYLPPVMRTAFIDTVRRLDATWVAIEGPRTLPSVAAQLTPDVDTARDFVVALDGRPIGLLGPHGQRYRPIAPDATMAA